MDGGKNQAERGGVLPIIDNSADVAAWWGRQAALRDHDLQVQNVAEYANYLDKKHGYYVMNDAKTLAVVMQWLREVLAAGLPLTDAHITKAIDGAGYEVINFLQSLTGEMRPPVKVGEGMRKAHPTGWADITRILAGSYEHIIDGKSPTQHPY